MPIPRIVRGQLVEEAKILRARQLRQAMTPEEKVLWDHLRGSQVHGLRFRRQQVIRGFIVDFYCHATAVVIEVDGEIHDQQQTADAERNRTLSQLGFAILRITNAQIRGDLAKVLTEISNTCKQRLQPGS